MLVVGVDDEGLYQVGAGITSTYGSVAVVAFFGLLEGHFRWVELLGCRYL